MLLDAILRDFGERITEPVTVVVENQLGQDLMVAMDADAFAICIRNLVENAALHGAKGRPIKLIVGQDWTIRVINEGAVVAADRLAVLKDRFVRGGLQPNGSGLGLAIVDRIMRQSDGALELTSPATGQTAGFEAKLILP